MVGQIYRKYDFCYENYIYLCLEMKNLLKYLLFFLVAASFVNCTDKSVSSVSDETEAGMSLIESLNHTNISASDSELCIPRQEQVVNGQRVQSTTRRTNNAHRNSVVFAKSGKVINAELRYFIQQKSIIIHSTLMEPTHRLLSLGKLII